MFAVWRKAARIELAKFAAVGLLNTFVGLAFIYSLKWYFQWEEVAANFVGYSICIALGFVLNGRWTFGRTVMNVRHLIGYFIVAAIAYLMNLMTVIVSIAVLNLQGDLAQLAGVPAFTLTSYLLSKFFVFSEKINNKE